MARCTVGTDPEFFLKKGGNYKSAIPHIKGTKHEPAKLPSGGTIQRDNVAMEFATDPAKDGRDLVEKVRSAFKDIKEMIPKNMEIADVPSAMFKPKELEHPEALQFGCDPDFDAWDISENEPPRCSNRNFRSCGGHIHVGHVEGDGNDFLISPMGRLRTVRAMDLFHGIISTILDSSKEAIERRKLYGKAGCHRPTEYGVEYRVLSNYWLKSPQLVMLMDSLLQDVLGVIRVDLDETLISKVGQNTIKQVINEGRVEDAKKILVEHLDNYMSEDSKALLTECLRNINTYDINKEWEKEVEV